MHKGHTLLELMVVLAIVGICLAVVTPRVLDVLDWIAADGAAHDVTVVLATARQEAILAGRAARVRLTADSLVTDLRDSGVWIPWRSLPGPHSSPACRWGFVAPSN